jgi:hypothetical protein
MFTNPYVIQVCFILFSATLSRLSDSVFSAFFREGQVLETFRGRGIYQPAVDTAIEKLDQGQWVCSIFDWFFRVG